MPQASDGRVHDLVGVGFGPSNLALAIAVEEQGLPLSMRFLERQQAFGWHRGMLLEDATMQISYLKDLVTLRDPTSSYSFLAYLKERGRLVDFINYGSCFPTRMEFHDYLEWAAARFTDRVDYGTRVERITAVPGEPELLDVHTDGGRVLRARNVVLATGLRPHLPPGVQPSERVWHSHHLLHNIGTVRHARRVIVAGAGQSAAEALDHLHRTFPDAEVCAVFSRYGYSPADDSSFANRIFDPDAVDVFFGSRPETKSLILRYHANTNYSVVDPELIEALYRRHYYEKVTGRERLRFLNVSRIADVVPVDDATGEPQVELVVESLLDGSREVMRADFVVYATGYRPIDPCSLLGDLADDCLRDDAGHLQIERDYRIRTKPAVEAGIYVQGATEHSHGISSTLLSNVSVRAGEIAESIAARCGVLDRRPDLASL
ncbi:L-ornithine N5-oxygenase [Pseudonocardia thermophila]|jgi:Lysine/ornithine N-monooxygenase|uniref:L-lysine N6-monooxygenase MbtG n=1 Tax=Pseudonocardia thermophila TaxID=1848 RepID=A0A1M7B0U4_PSETH|nr:lysine N(6)-hydroxylase/L-ornithine N(5)-oxygenase family protein [Pseudonocardia thermophila]SHL48561.1 L-ornithine N5-oxygenase [Pseudonocardia thermophila]